MPLIDRTDSVLIVVDMQPLFMAHESMTPEVQAEARASLDRAVWLAGIATLFDIPAVVVEEGSEHAGKTDPRLMQRLPEGTPVRVKKTFGLVGEPAALEAITATQRKTVVLVGFQTNTCVAQSAIELHDLGFRVVAAEDGMYTSSATKHERGLRRMEHAGVEVHDCKGITYEWARVVDLAFDVTARSAAKWGDSFFAT